MRQTDDRPPAPRHCPARRPDRAPTVALALAALALTAALPAAANGPGLSPGPTPGPTPDAARSDALVRMVRQDCGSCHGMQLTGGLGPALTREALADKPLEGLVATIYRGRPGTPMPGWQSMLSEPEAQWIAERLMAGFPQEKMR